MPSTSYSSIAAMVYDRVAKTPTRDAFYSPSPSAPGGWKTWSWSDVGSKVRAVAAGLRSLNIQDEDRVALLSGTRVEWILADLGVLCGGGATTTVYPSNTAEECQYILEDSGTVGIFAEDDSQVAKILSVKEQLPALRFIVTIDGKAQPDQGVMTLEELEAEGARWLAANEGGLEAVAERLTPQHLATLIYTSGTTGKPKGVELLHDCWLYTGEAMESLGIMGPDDKQFLWLPMSHSFGKVLEVAVIQMGVPTAIDGEIPKIVDNLAVVQPTFMAAAPRIFEKVYNKVVTGAREAGGLKWKIFRWALKTGMDVSKLKQAGKEPTGLLAFKYRIADKLVFSKLRARFGGRIKYFISGSAPLSREMAEFFHAAGMLICEGYGLTESSAASFVNRPNDFRFGTVGQGLPGTEVKLLEEDGEILIKSRGIMRGYWNLPEKTAQTLTDGWLHTGDIGEVDSDGKLRITDRKKDLIKTSGGKYVAPQHLEGSLKALSPLISQVLVHGDRRNYCSALLTLDEEAIAGWAREHGKAGKSYADLTKDPDVRKALQPSIDKLNSGLASYETIKKFAILPSDFAVETGELTPSLKVKRKVVETRYQEVLDGFYEDALAKV